jgi:hypothetical protein
MRPILTSLKLFIPRKHAPNQHDILPLRVKLLLKLKAVVDQRLIERIGRLVLRWKGNNTAG